MVEYFQPHISEYAILSNTWGANSDDITYKDMVDSANLKTKSGYRKIQFCCKQTILKGLRHFWIDTCCIDKSSSAELSEAINSMYRWYSLAGVCFVYLSDVPEVQLRRSRWFTRGWTLQELLAPSQVEFFTAEGFFLGTRHLLCSVISEVTEIPAGTLQTRGMYDEWTPSNWTVAERLSWTRGRQTKRGEDSVYCLLGILEVRILPIYGEGRPHAFKRLLREIYGPGNYHGGRFLSHIEFESPPTEGKGTEARHDYMWYCCYCMYGPWPRASFACGDCGYGRCRSCPSMAVPRTGPDQSIES